MKIYHTYSEEANAEGFYNEEGVLVASWSLNEAVWGDMYFEGLMRFLKVEVDYSNKHKLDLETEWGVA